MKKQLLILLSLVALTSCNGIPTTIQKKVEEYYDKEINKYDVIYSVVDFHCSPALGSFSTYETCKHNPTHYYCEYYLVGFSQKENQDVSAKRIETYVAYCSQEERIYFYA